MLSDFLIKKTNLPVVSRSLDAAMLRSRVIANNIANINTPGFRRTEVSFEKELKGALDRSSLQGSRTNENHLKLGRLNLAEVGPKAYTPVDPTTPSGVNNVDIDMEMAKLAEAQIMYNYSIKFGQGVFKKLNAAVSGRTIPE
ncbi:MAG: flagellar basal body rod protein FlgB [Chitinispirillaceae bacterium]|jgi:flagellar basal-body rod protein FlgB|nr:flagellar basal body rod protein FlgB [Chitinispirillaceae bacterium]